MNKFQSLVDDEMRKIHEAGPDAKDPDISVFYEALLGNENFCNGLCNAMEKIATSFAGAIMTKPETAGDLRAILTTRAFARPLLGLTYMGYLMGRSAGQIDSMEKMFSLEGKDAN